MFSPIEDQPTLALAVSGGADSLGLMLLVARWLEESKPRPKVIVYSLDHGFRAEAAGEVAFVLRVARDMGFEARGLALPVEPGKFASQADAREQRYSTIARAMARDGAKILLSGHHRQDQAETVLMRLAHGSGIAGLGGMRQFSCLAGIRIFRPLLSIEPARLARLVAEAGLKAVLDPSNSYTKYERTRWRQALPELDGLGLTPKRLADFSTRMARAEVALAKMSQSLFRENAVCDRFGLWQLDWEIFIKQSDEVGIRLLMAMLCFASGRARDIRLGRVEALYSRLRLGLVGAQTLSGCAVEVREGFLAVFRESSRIDRSGFELEPGKIILWDQRFNIENHSHSPLWVKSAIGLGRKKAEQIAGCKIVVPMAVVGGAPLVTGQADELLALGATKGHPGVEIDIVGLQHMRENNG